MMQNLRLYIRLLNMDSERLDLRPVRPLDQATHFCLGHQLALGGPISLLLLGQMLATNARV